MVLLKFHDMSIRESFSQPWIVKLWNVYRKVRGHKFSHVSVIDYDGMEIYFPVLGDKLESVLGEDVDKMVATSETWNVPTTNFWFRSYDYLLAPPPITTCSNWVWYGLTGEIKELVTPDEVYEWVTNFRDTKAVRAVVAKTI